MFKLFTIIAFLFIGQCVYGQSKLQVISSAGQELESENFNLNFTIGEPVVKEFINDGLIIGQGFQQTFSSVRTNVNDKVGDFRFSYFPNPTFDKLMINYTSVITDYTIQIATIEGHIINNTPLEYIDNKTMEIDLTDFISGSYIISVVKKIDNQRVTKLKVIKL